MTAWRSFEISWRFATHHAESLPANHWSLRQSDHEQVTNHRAHWTPPIRIHTYKWNWKFRNGIEKFLNGYNSRRRRLLCVLFFGTWSTGTHPIKVKKSSAYDVRKAPIGDLVISIHKTRSFEWQTAHTKWCQEIAVSVVEIWPWYSAWWRLGDNLRFALSRASTTL